MSMMNPVPITSLPDNIYQSEAIIVNNIILTFVTVGVALFIQNGSFETITIFTKERITCLKTVGTTLLLCVSITNLCNALYVYSCRQNIILANLEQLSQIERDVIEQQKTTFSMYMVTSIVVLVLVFIYLFIVLLNYRNDKK